MTEPEASLSQIEGDDWGNPPPDATRLIRNVHELRQKPAGELTPEDLRELVAQQVGIPVVVPLALTLLADEPRLEAVFYPGDLLVAVLGVPDPYWSDHPTELARLRGVIAAVENPDGKLSADIDTFEEGFPS